MATLNSKYNFKDIVYTPYTYHDSYTETCPVCEGTGKLKVEGKDILLNCNNCGNSYSGSYGYITKYKYYAGVTRLTVGQIRIKMEPNYVEIQYMCEETGIGSGTLHYEHCLFDSYEEAMKIAEEITEIANTTGKQVYLSDYLK